MNDLKRTFCLNPVMLCLSRKGEETMSKIRLNAYTIINRAIEEGVACGIARSFKYHEHPTEEVLEFHLEHELGLASIRGD
jgi:hypothetical protein